jgi:hydrogenase expression/formation protein HypC
MRAFSPFAARQEVDMCIGIPMQVLDDNDYQAWCQGPEGPVLIDLALVGRQERGAWLLTFMGAAREVLDPDVAARITAALDAARIDGAFADLAGRTPQLPEHLRTKGGMR